MEYLIGAAAVIVIFYFIGRNDPALRDEKERNTQENVEASTELVRQRLEGASISFSGEHNIVFNNVSTVPLGNRYATAVYGMIQGHSFSTYDSRQLRDVKEICDRKLDERLLPLLPTGLLTEIQVLVSDNYDTHVTTKVYTHTAANR